MPLLLKILGIKVVGTAISLIVFLTKTGPGFTPITITHENDSLEVTTVLKKAFTRGLEEIILSGTEVGIFYTCMFLERDPDGFIAPLYEETYYRYLVYNAVDDNFLITTDSTYSTEGNDPEKAKNIISSITVRVAAYDDIDPEHDYAVRFTASLNTIEIEAIEASNFDLNAFWNFSNPTEQTEWRSGEELRSR
jgi:hypothetical protein